MTIEDSDIEDAGKAPRRVRTDEGTVEEKSVQELIDADRYGQDRKASAKVPWGMRVARTRPGGTV